ncbi:hypothetical protein IEQ34_003129 [Dendrobium chrysotoxum]|uniref:Uncharacterized protein n=1 Tax=Dendrobium chrysotoxum TaxID=161865 RepID=A0AAV7HHT6_DENCH|nr:hypothetical protein IEQ34_003129 [Dendrobium chrysotoxum]
MSLRSLFVLVLFSSWDYICYISNVSTQGDVHEKRREKLKKDVKRLIKEKSFADQLELFDSLRKLGVAYHFEVEVKYLLNLMKYSVDKFRMEFTEDVHVTTLYFRLSREHGFEVSKGQQCFKPCVLHDIKEPLSLYEALFLSMDAEDEIDEAKEFALKHLNDCMRSNSSTNLVLAKHISLALELPLHHRIQKLQVSMFIEHAQNMKELDVDPILLEFSQLDFNMTQSTYNKELKEITRWWKKISNIACGVLSFAREWPVESYFLAVGVAKEPCFSTCKKEFAKAICFINVVDDIYDIYDSLDELKLFTDVVESGWIYAKHIWWRFVEYLDNAWISVADPLGSVMELCLSENLTNLSLESFDFYPSIIRQSSIIFRLYNDLETSKGELRRGDISKSI